MQNNSPCERNCPNRTSECRKTCPEWAVYEAEKMEEYARRKKIYEDNMAYQEMMENAVKRMRRGKRK